MQDRLLPIATTQVATAQAMESGAIAPTFCEPI